MLEIYQTTAGSVKKELESLLAPYICGKYGILYTENGKPYVENNPIYFSVSHSGDVAVIAIADKPVGIDIELLKERRISALLSRYTMRERDYISGSIERFLKNWVAKEAYIKMTGGTIAQDLKRLEYFDGRLFADGIEKTVIFKEISGAICAVCLGE